ncbi:EscU/YscU/HrcU family type III secretion system export apparatus switch protein [Oceanobacillus jeddahense]|uniref:EscU/YscU/HrcU family type III secretion system export apparatus switch protein n=1 Tax=Oceanobacillus jeddahense TaxID=1462527 RepID=A0ABY5JSH2_9BACI|nr:EscU/YscU/HrcU family type III secretion system export apparatus switch protein [Oceanobacillus jeddahense]UUI01554.1 EscU/YscU/HrcU family type III secretion system export apparatus switch protein [Oceanobacillus jeddahense]
MNEKRKKAVALSYEQSMDDAPRIKASGKGFLAEEIIERAQTHDIPILEDPSLVEVLAELNINEQIPEELFQVVSEVFAFIYQTDKQTEKENL